MALATQFIDTRHQKLLPKKLLRSWVDLGIVARKSVEEILLRFTTTEEMQNLNRSYRNKDYATNVLTFCFHQNPATALQADIILCPAVIEQESQTQNKALLAHYAHMILHGVLHAQGYDHEDPLAAEMMEAIEIRLLAQLGFANPYV